MKGLMPKSLGQLQREIDRGKIIELVYKTRPKRISDRLLWRNIEQDSRLEGMIGLRQELYYLGQKNLLDLHKADTQWSASITATGIDFIEGNTGTIIGITHPDLC